MSGSRNTLFEPLRITDPSTSDNPLIQGTPSQGAALGDLYTAALAERQRQMQISRERGLWTGGEVWEGGHPTQAGVADIGGQYTNALLLGTTTPGVRAYHGSPHSFERFDTSKIGTGEGAQAYGHGLYFAEKEGTAKSYRDQGVVQHQVSVTDPASGRVYKPGDPYYEDAVKMYGSPGKMYEVNIGAEPEHFLHWDKRLSEQHPAVQEKLRAAGAVPDPTEINTAGHFGYSLNEFKTLTPEYQRELIAKLPAKHANYAGDPRGSEIYESSKGKDPAALAQRLQEAGIPGIRYLDQGSRGAGEGTHNYVVFDAATIDILRKYGIAGLMAGGAGAAAATNGSQQPTQ